jgi:hypothetical protein
LEEGERGGTYIDSIPSNWFECYALVVRTIAIYVLAPFVFEAAGGYLSMSVDGVCCCTAVDGWEVNEMGEGTGLNWEFGEEGGMRGVRRRDLHP